MIGVPVVTYYIAFKEMGEGRVQEIIGDSTRCLSDQPCSRRLIRTIRPMFYGTGRNVG
jgi:hypothetical protein